MRTLFARIFVCRTQEVEVEFIELVRVPPEHVASFNPYEIHERKKIQHAG